MWLSLFVKLCVWLYFLLTFLQKENFMIKLDLTSAYHFVEIFRPHTTFLGFAWSDNFGTVHFYKFLVLPFGLSSACYVFTLLTRPSDKFKSISNNISHIEIHFGALLSLDMSELAQLNVYCMTVRNPMLIQHCLWNKVNTSEAGW